MPFSPQGLCQKKAAALLPAGHHRSAEFAGRRGSSGKNAHFYAMNRDRDGESPVFLLVS
jgi:hypothetical protein